MRTQGDHHLGLDDHKNLLTGGPSPPHSLQAAEHPEGSLQDTNAITLPEALNSSTMLHLSQNKDQNPYPEAPVLWLPASLFSFISPTLPSPPGLELLVVPWTCRSFSPPTPVSGPYMLFLLSGVLNPPYHCSSPAKPTSPSSSQLKCHFPREALPEPEPRLQ